MPSELGEWLKAELAKRGWSTRKLALRAGVTPASVTNIVRTGSTPQMESILKTAEALEEEPMLMLHLAGIQPTLVRETTQEEELVHIVHTCPTNPPGSAVDDARCSR